jgi:hypothetical protein
MEPITAIVAGVILSQTPTGQDVVCSDLQDRFKNYQREKEIIYKTKIIRVYPEWVIIDKRSNKIVGIDKSYFDLINVDWETGKVRN